MKNTQSNLLLALVLVSILFSSCSKTFFGDVNGIESGNSQDVAFPLVNSRFTSRDLLLGLNNLTTVEALPPDGRLVLVFNQPNVFSRNASDAVNLPLPTFNVTDTLTNLSAASLAITELRLNNGQLYYDFISPVTEDINVQMQLIGGTYTTTGAPLKVNLNFPYTGSTHFTGSISLANTRVLTSGFGGLQFRYDARKVSDNTRLTLSPFSLSFQSLDYTYAQGGLLVFTYPVPLDTIQFDAFRTLRGGELYLENPSIELKIQNTIGLPIGIKLDSLLVRDKLGNVTLMTGSYVNQVVPINYPSLSEIGVRKTTTMVFDNSNTNISQAITGLPQEIYYTGDVASTGLGQGHVTDSSYISIDVAMRLPFRCWSRNLLIVDTFDVDLTPFTDYRFFEFKTATENRVPADVYGQIYFTGDDLVPFDSLFVGDDRVFVSPPVDANGRASTSMYKSISTRFEGARKLDVQSRTTHIIVQGKATSLNNGNTIVELYDDNDFYYRLGLKVGL